MKDDDAVGLLKDRSQIVVEVDRRGPPLPRPQERGDHVGLHRAGTKQRDVDDEVVEVLGGELADELALAGRLDLEAAQGARGLHERVGTRVIEGHSIEFDALAVDALDLADRVGESRLHAYAEHVELEQAELLDVVLVELAHRVALGARLDRGAIEQGGVGEQHPARVHGDMPREPVEGLDEGPEVVKLAARGHAAQPGVAQLGQVAQGIARIAGAHMGEGLGQGVDLAGRQRERGPDIADGMAHAVGLHHRYACDALGAEPLEDRVVDLEPARGLDVDVDIGQLSAQGGEEPLHQQAVMHRVDAGDTE